LEGLAALAGVSYATVSRVTNKSGYVVPKTAERVQAIIDEVEVGLEQDPEVIYTEYQRPDRDEWTAVILPILSQQNLAALARKSGVSERQLRSLVKHDVYPRCATQQRIAAAVRAVTASIVARGPGAKH
jgi:lambda repressor-like predicted transcriptional regulator